MDALAVNVAVVGIGADDAPAKTVVERLEAAGHRILGRKQLAAGAPLLEVLTDWIENADIDVVLAVAPDTDPVRAAMSPLVSRPLPGFGELLRAAAFPEIGSAAMLLDGEAAKCGSTYLFVLPGTVGAVKVAMDQLLIPQLDSRTRPSNLVSKLPRLRGVPPPADAFAEREITDVGTPPPPGKTVPPPRASKTMPPPVPQKKVTKTPPMGVVLRATPVDPAAAADAEMIRSDAAILIPPAEIVEPQKQAEPEKQPEPEKHADTVAADQLGAFVMSLEQHAQKLRAEKSEVGPLPQPPAKPKTQPPPITGKTDAEMKAVRDASVAEAISKSEPMPQPPVVATAEAAPKPPAEPRRKTTPPPPSESTRRKTTPPPVPEAATSEPPKRKKNETTPQQWAKASDAMEKIAPSAVRNTGTLSAASPVLAQGDRVIVIPQHRTRRTWLWVPLALAVGVGGGFLVKNIVVSGNRTASADPQPAQPAQPDQVVKVESVEALPSPPAPTAAQAAATGSAADAVPATPEIEMDPNGGNLTALAQGHGHHAAPAPGSVVALTGHTTSAAGSAAGSAVAEAGSAVGSDEAFDPRTHPNIAPASPDCDEASCILEGYKRECCARYKPAEVVVDAGPSGPPQTLDKAAVIAGLADLKPAVQQCGEQHPAKGEVSVTLTVSPDGHVTAATVAASPDPTLGQCVAKVLERATFEKTQQVTTFTYPFTF